MQQGQDVPPPGQPPQRPPQEPAQPPQQPAAPRQPQATQPPGQAHTPPPPAPPARRPWYARAWVPILLIFALAACCAMPALVGLAGLAYQQSYFDGIAVIHIDALITGTGEQDLLGSASVTPEYVIDLMQAADADPGIEAILLRIDSPGGTASASQEIAMEVPRIEKPVVASVGDVAASGAYLIASQCDHVVASPSSSVGSIGVIIQIPNYEGLLDKIGVGYTVLTTGEFKDTGSPYRSLTETETLMLEEDMELILDQFIEAVAEGRDLPEEDVREMATGWVWPGSEALEMGLVDSLGNYSDGVDEAAAMAGVEDPLIVYYDQPGPLDVIYWFLSSATGFDLFADALPDGSDGIPVPR